MIYFDNNATTAVEPAVLDRMLPFFTEHYGNPSNTSHALGWAADEAVNLAREDVAGLVGGSPDDVIFTAGATEAINMAIRGVAAAATGRHIVTVATEHKAVLETCRSLEADGFEITVLPVNADGVVSVRALERVLRPDTVLTCVMWANNETGAVQPVERIAAVLADHPSLFFCDATQAVGKLPISMDGVDLLALSGHKFYGPKGVGALLAKPSVRLVPVVRGGGQEKSRRAGTLNVPGIVGLGAAAAVAGQRLDADRRAMQDRRDRFENAVLHHFPDARVNSAGAERLPQTSSIMFPDIKAADMMAQIGTVAVSTGSACSTGSGKPSHVLAAMGLDKQAAAGTVRFSMGRHTTDQEVDAVVRALAAFS
ncbi:MAG: cysteine desulfurase family protein [Rhodothermales bacterium]